MLSSEQRAEFDRRGLVRLPAAVGVGAVTTMHDRIWAFLSAERGIDRSDRATWPAGTPRRLQALRRAGTFAAMASDPALATAHPWLGEVWAGRVRANGEAVVGGVRVVLREVTGTAGDIVFMHPRTLHAAAPNTNAEPRMILVELVGRA